MSELDLQCSGKPFFKYSKGKLSARVKLLDAFMIDVMNKATNLAI